MKLIIEGPEATIKSIRTLLRRFPVKFLDDPSTPEDESKEFEPEQAPATSEPVSGPDEGAGTEKTIEDEAIANKQNKKKK